VIRVSVRLALDNPIARRVDFPLIAADHLANSLCAFLTPFWPEARKLAAERPKQRGEPQGEEG
jgi:hypothetical protein